MRYNPFSMTRLARVCFLLLFAVSFGSLGAYAQDNPNYGVLNFKTKLGSFKVPDGQGELTFSFKGTVLVSKLKGTVNVSGNVRKEYEGREKRVFFGQGTITVKGTWRAVQWFGTDLSARWYGAGMIELVGEFDRNLETGKYWYGERVDKSENWGPYMTTRYLPDKTQIGTNVEPRVRNNPINTPKPETPSKPAPKPAPKPKTGG